MLAGSFPRWLSPFQLRAGRIGLGVKPPPQFEQTLKSTCSTHVRQKVHSYEQMRASVELGGKGVLQCSQLGLSSSMSEPTLDPLTGSQEGSLDREVQGGCDQEGSCGQR